MMACDDVSLSTFQIKCSLKVFCSIILQCQSSEHQWWLLDETKVSRGKYGNALTLFDQIGVASSTFASVYGSRWRNKSRTVLPFPLAMTKFNDCNFVTVCRDESGRVSTPSVAESCIVKMDNDKMQYVKDLISERVQLKVDAYLRAMTDESSTADANDMDTSFDTTTSGDADTSFDTTTSGDTDTSMEEVDGSSGVDGNASSAAAEKRKSTADQASADGTTANKVSRDATSQDTGSAKASSTTLSPELLALKDVLFDSQGNLKQDVATVVQLCIKDKKKLAPQELRLAGCLLKKAIDGHAEKSQVRVVVVDLHR